MQRVVPYHKKTLNLSGSPALMLATNFFQCDKEILELLINPATKIDFEVKDYEGKTVLHKVIENLEMEKERFTVIGIL